MNVSGIYVVLRPAGFEAGVEALGSLPGVRVHQRDPTTGRLVVTQEARSVGAEAEGFERIRRLPDVVDAQLVYHCFDVEPRHFPELTESAHGLDPSSEHPVSATPNEPGACRHDRWWQ